MIKFKDLNSFKHSISGNHWLVLFPNGYGLSIIDGDIFYTSNEAPYEVALISHDLELEEPLNPLLEDCDYQVIYNNDFNDVKGFQTENKIDKLIDKVFNYESRLNG